ncbi:MAG: 5-oxoprolinase subunit PxpA [Pyrinomonadaceae bacterium]|nr:5-oxoprolinase subunit PxpA [Pyrinomonadaceae bacterium]
MREKMTAIDLNCDMGEGCGNDAELMMLISSANIACGFHAGDEETMRATVKLAADNGVAVGAHPSYPDRQNFGRNEMELPLSEIKAVVTEQVLKLQSICDEFGVPLTHVKPHGALYNRSARDTSVASAIAEAVHEINPEIILFGLAGSYSITEAERLGLRTTSEVFADRTYQPDGSLTPRSQSNALIADERTAVAQVLQMVLNGTVTAVNGTAVPVRADTICIHGDGEHAVEFARAMNDALRSRDISIKPIE